MPPVILARTFAIAFCGAWLFTLLPSWAKENEGKSERVETIKLVGGVMDIVTVHDGERKYAKVRFKGHEMDLGYGGALHYATIRLAGREIVIVQTWGDVKSMPPDYHLVAVTFQGAVKHIKNKSFSSADDTFKTRRQGNVLYFDLGFEDGLKKRRRCQATT